MRSFMLFFLVPLFTWADPYFQDPAGVPKPAFADVHYGKHKRHVLDLWQAPGAEKAPLLIWIHGGGFRAGTKSVKKVLLEECLKAGISVAAINYRYSTQAPGLAPFMDGARAVQFLRYKARAWKIDPARFACAGNSAGAGIAFWIGFHDDLADSKAKDPVCRQSTRVLFVGSFDGQCTYDPITLKALFPSEICKLEVFEDLFNVKLADFSRFTPKQKKLFAQCSPINFLTKDDPPVFMVYSWPDEPVEKSVRNLSVQIHHPLFGKVLKARMDSLGIPCSMKTGVRPYILDKSMAPPKDSEKIFHESLREFVAKLKTFFFK